MNGYMNIQRLMKIAKRESKESKIRL